MNDTKVVVLGGGIAGWMTVLYMAEIFPNNVVAVQQKGYNEPAGAISSTPSLVNYLHKVRISPRDVIKFANGTIKHGVVVRDGDVHRNIVLPYRDKILPLSVSEFKNYIDWVVASNLQLEEHVYADMLIKSGKVDIFHARHGLHFDGPKFAALLEFVGRCRGVKVIEADTIVVEPQDSSMLVTADGVCVQAELFFECVGDYERESVVVEQSELDGDDVWPYTAVENKVEKRSFHIPLQDRVDTVHDTAPISWCNDSLWLKNWIRVGPAACCVSPHHVTMVPLLIEQLRRIDGCLFAGSLKSSFTTATLSDVTRVAQFLHNDVINADNNNTTFYDSSIASRIAPINTHVETIVDHDEYKQLAKDRFALAKKHADFLKDISKPL